MAKAGGRRLALDFEVCEVAVHHLTVDNHGFEVAKLILQLSFLVFAAEVVDALLDRVTLCEYKFRWLSTGQRRLKDQLTLP